MDVRALIKEMIQQGLSDEEIVANLKELGIEDVDKAVADALAQEEKGQPAARKEVPINQSPDLPEMESIGGAEENKEEKREAREKQEEPLDEAKQLFDTAPAQQTSEEAEEAMSQARPLFASKPRKGETGMEGVKPLFEEPKKSAEEVPKLEITSVGEQGERQTDIAEMLNRKPPEIPQMPQTRMADIDAVERKLDDLQSAIKALQEINRQILDANREILFRMKTQK